MSMQNILIIDDDNLVLRTIGKALKANGYEVGLAESGEKAIEMASNKKYETVLTDLSMPNMDGFETMKHIHGNIRKLYMTGYSKKYFDVDIDFLAKPFGVTELLAFLFKTREGL